MSVIVVGRNSFLAKAVRQNPATKDWRFISHSEALDRNVYNGTDCVINFAIHDEIKRGNVTDETDLDSRIARLIAHTPTHYILISSRTVYGQSKHGGVLYESDPLDPATAYGKAKKQIEENVATILPHDRLTILRLSNIFGDEAVAGRSTFFAMALTRLRDQGSILFDMDPAVPRDFLPATLFADYIVHIASAPVAGIYDLGSGFGTPVGDIANWLIEGHGSGELIVSDNQYKDAFWLGMDKTVDAFGLTLPVPARIAQECREIASRLTQSR